MGINHRSPRMLVTENKTAFLSRKTNATSSNETVVASNINRQSRRKSNYDEASMMSDHSSLGSRMQIPHGFRIQNNCKLSKSAQQVFPASSRSSTSSREMLRQEANVERLVLEAKQSRPTQEVAAMIRQMQDPIVVQSMSVKLPAACYHQTKTKSYKSSSQLLSMPFFFSKGLDAQSGWKQTTNDFQTKSWVSSAANSFVREEQKKRRHGDVGNKQNIQGSLGSNLVALPEEEESEGKSSRKWAWKAYCRILPRHYSPIANRRNKAQAF